MTSLIELVEKVNSGEAVDPAELGVYQESANGAEKFLAHHAAARVGLGRCRTHLLEALDAIGYGDEKVLRQYLAVADFLGHADAAAEPIARFAETVINRNQPALGVEALASAVREDQAAGGVWAGDAANARHVADLYARAAASLGFETPGHVPPGFQWNNKQTRVALVLGQIADDDAATAAALALAGHLDQKRFKLFVYATEAEVRREGGKFGKPAAGLPSARRGKTALDAFDRAKATCWIAPTDGDAATAAVALADQFLMDRVDVALYDTGPADAVAALTAHWPLSRAKALVRRGPALPAADLGAVVFPAAGDFEREKSAYESRGVAARHVAEGVDPAAAAGDGPKRKTYGIPESAVVMATAAESPAQLGEAFVGRVVELLRANPHAVLLLVGGGDWAWHKRKFEAAGVAKRVGYAGRRKDLGSFLKIADVYLAPFPEAPTAGVLRAMAAGVPVVAALWGDSPEQSAAATLVGPDATIAGRDPQAYVDRAAKLVRDAGYRAKLGNALRERAEKHYSFAETARQIEHLCDELIQRAADSADSAGPAADAPADFGHDTGLAKAA